jgi:hypothetical protein
VIWEPEYRVPNDVAGDVCEYPLARNLVLIAVAMASEAVVQFVDDGRRISRALTLRDMAVSRPEPA